MDTVIGLGAAGCRIAEQFANYPQYEVYKIDIGLIGENCYNFPRQNTPEEYEKFTPDMSDFFKDIEGDILFVVGGGGKISGATLQILKQLKNCNINLLYIKPESKSLTKTGLLQDKVAYGVLQEYARSGIFNRIYLISNLAIEAVAGEIPILEYNKKINEVIVNAFHYINVFVHTDAVVQNIESPKETQRISTIGIFNIKANEEMSFFPLQNIGHRCYYYAIPEQVLKTDGKLFKMIKEKASENQSSYEVHTTKHSDSFCYFVAHTNFIQPLDNL
jgi:hypothetical protein